jgi:hypothetical protein
MFKLRDWLKTQTLETLAYNTALFLGNLATSLVLGVYAYLGLFTRYLADDYCHTNLIAANGLIGGTLEKYLNTSDRYSTLIIVSFSEWFGPHGISFLPAIMIILWIIGLFWMLWEIKEITNLRWKPLAGFLFVTSVAFLSILQAPNRYQTIYWRSSMVTHFAPLVFIPFLGAFMIRRIRLKNGQRTTLWANLVCFLGAFLIGGFSEPPDAIQIVVSGLALVAVWLWIKGQMRRSALITLAWAFAGALLSMVTMYLSPANVIRLGIPPPSFPVLTELTLRFTIDFVLDTIRTLPLPSLVSVAVPALIVYGLYSLPPRQELSKQQKVHLWIAIVVIPALMYLLIAASFAPSAYGQSYPVPRARFAGRLMMTTALMLEGALLGVLAAQVRVPAIKPSTLSILAAILLGIAALYPLRATWKAYADLPEYRQRAAAWDTRDAQIKALVAEGKKRIVVEQLPGVEGVKELDTRARHWVNRCAAEYYGVNSIRAKPFSNNSQ